MRVCSFCRRCHDDAACTCTEEGHPPLSETIDGSPEMIGGYRLETLADSGVKGNTFRARQIECGRSCLITVVRTDASTQFLDEANLAASLFHPNLAAVYEAGTLGSGECFVVAEDPEDRSLRRRLEDHGSPALLQTVEIIRQTAEALHALHENGLVHRALRPESIILGAAGEHPTVRLQHIDFGGVATRSIISNKFLIDSAVDSIKYFAPEQCSGEALSPQTDIYSLGIVLYEMLAGAPPFDSATAAGVIDQHRNHRPPDIRIDNFELRMLITHTLMESLHKRPEKRQSSANAFARQLRHIEQLATHVSTPPPVVRVAPRKIDKPAAIASPAPQPVITPIVIETPPKPISETAVEPAARIAAQPAAAVTPAPIPDVQIPLPAAVAEEDAGSGSSAVETFGAAIASFVKERSAPAISHFSRLKERRRKLHTKAPESVSDAPAKGDAEKRRRLVSPAEAAIELEKEMAAVRKTRAKKAKKVEWSQPEDDIPSLADVSAFMAAPAVIEPIAVSEIATTPLMEDPIPTITAPAVEAERPEPLVETISKAAAEPEILKPALAPKPAGQKPQVSAAVEPESKPEAPAIVPVHRPAAKPARMVPTGNAAKQPPVPAACPKPETFFDLKPRGIRISGIQSGAAKRPVKLDELEEITLVSAARSRFRVDVNKPQPARKPARRVVPIPSADSVFYPTLLGGAVKPAASEPAAESILSAYHPASDPHALPYRSLAAAGGLVLLIAFFLLAGEAVWKFAPDAASGEPVSAITAASAEPLAPARREAPRPSSGTIPPKTVEKPQLKTGEAAPAATASRTSFIPERPAPDRTARLAVPPRPAPEKPRTVAEPEPTKRPALKAAPIPVRSNGATRPRIVKIDQ